MKTTIDQALNKVFQQPVHTTAERRPVECEPQGKGSPRSSTGGGCPLELYIDSPHSTPRPICAASLRDAITFAPQPGLRCDEKRSSAGVAPAMDSVNASAPPCDDVIRPWDESWVFQTLVSPPPAEEVVSDRSREVDDASCLPESAPGSESAPAVVLENETDDAVSDFGASDSGCADAEAVFRPAWEVDSLGLPPICRQVVEQVSEELSDVCRFLQPERGEPRNLVSIDSCTREEGRTTVALALAHTLAQQGQRILLIDADFSRPQLATQLGLAVSQGWENAVTGDLSAEDCCIYSIGDGFAVLPLGHAGLVVQDLQTLQRIQSLLLDLSMHFDRVILDQGPGGHGWVSLPPQRLLAHVVVRSLRTTSNESLEQFMHRIPQRPEVLVSFIDNFATPSAVAVARSA